MLYEYQVVDLKNRKIRGVLDAASSYEVRNILRERKFFVLWIKEKNAQGWKNLIFYKGKNKLKFNSLVNFTRQMGIMINAGLSLIDALNIFVSQTTNLEERSIYSKIEEYIKSGNSLSVALKNYPESFPDYYVSLIKAGESSGKLDDVFLRLADNLEKSQEFRSKLTNSLIYPIVVMVVILIVGFIMLTFVLPKLLTLYTNFNIELPLTTKVIIFVSNFFSQFWPIIILTVFIFVSIIATFFRKPENKKIFDSYLLRFPVIGKIIKESVLVESTRTLSILLRSGVHILEALNIVKDSTGNLVYKEAFSEIYERVEKGETLGNSLANSELFPQIFVQLTAVGEKTGKLDDTLFRLSRFFELESETAIKAATTLIEPLILIFLGIAVAFLVIGILMPIYNLTSSFGNIQ